MRKINLVEFQTSKLTLNERLNTKGGSGCTRTTYHRTLCCATDSDTRRRDGD
jgi:hypothetical protein